MKRRPGDVGFVFTIAMSRYPNEAPVQTKAWARP
jgi:hypothetical protein